jgi:Tfp pilus assembly protein PilF
VAPLAAATDLCGPVEPAATPDPIAASAYVDVAEDELSRNNRSSAQFAFREALRLDPKNARARAGLTASCEAPATDDGGLAEAVALLNVGDCESALPRFRAAAKGDSAGEARLLEGICLYQLGRDTEATSALEAASKTAEHTESAQFFLGLIALRRGERNVAEQLFGSVAISRDRGLSADAASMLGLVWRDGKVVVSGALEGGYESNTDLEPDGSPTAPITGEAVSGVVSASLSLRPFGLRGPYARVSGAFRRQLIATPLDLATLGAVAGVRLGSPMRWLGAEYGYDRIAADGGLFLSAHRLLAEGAWTLERLVAGARYAVRFQQYPAADLLAYSGVRHLLELETRLPLGPVSLTGGLRGVRNIARAPELSFWEGGPLVSARLPLFRGARLTAETALARRGYDAFDPFYGLQRADGYWDLGGLFELDLGRFVTLQASSSFRAAMSNVPNLTPFWLTGWLGLSFTAGLL